MTSTETRTSWSERLNPRNWTLVWKLAVVGLLPAVLALVLGVLRVADQAGDAADLGRSTRLLEVQQQVTDAAGALRGERDEATLYVAEQRAGDRGVLEIGFGKADIEVGEMLTTVRGATELDPTTISALQQAESELSLLPVLRGDVTDNGATGVNQVRGRYTKAIEGIDVLDRALLRQLRTPETAGLADALTAVTSANEQLAIQHTVLGTAIRAKRLQTGDITAVTATDNQLTADYREYQVALTPDQLTRFGNFLDDAANSQRERLKSALLATQDDKEILLQPFEWDTAYNGSRAAADRSAQLLRSELVNTSIAAEQAASNNAGIQSVILMLGLLAGITVAILVARALIRSLRVLRTAALDVAERRLPQAVESMRAGESPDIRVDAVPITTSDEVGQVARAFDAVHGQAVRLAAEQAALQSNVSAMFVNLSRRSQALVERQLQLIEQLESNEQDPDQLSNLFQLDHLATRMRRNSENLLVLAGTDLAKRNAAPIPLVDVLRAAVSEVEQYQRIIVQSPPTATVAGRAGADLVHLLAELLDNATNFSPPDSQVVMSSARTSDGSVVVEISDRGVGMVEHELADANQRLGGPSSVDVSASRRMGLFVVGRLGARHGVNVRLGAAAGNGQSSGLTASVTVPAYLISATPGSGDGSRQFAGQPGQAGPNGLPQRVGPNGAGTNGSLSALVAGTDGPSNPTSVFDSQQVQETGGTQLGGPPPAANGGPLLPTRRPGSTLRPNRDGPPLPPDPDRPEGPPTGEHSWPEDPRRSGDDRAREIAEQARRDQESAARRTAAMRQNPGRQDQQQFPGSAPDQNFFGNGNGNGTTPGIPSPGPTRDRQPQGRADTGRTDNNRPDNRPDANRPDNGWQDSGWQDGGRQDSGRQDSGRQDTNGRPDNGRPNGARPDNGRPDNGRPNAAPDNGRPDNGRPDNGRSEEDARGGAQAGPPSDPGAERSQFAPPPLPRRVPGTSSQPPARPSARDTTDDGSPRSLHPTEPAPRQQPEQRGQQDRPQQDQSRSERALPELPQRVAPSELPKREPRASRAQPFSGPNDRSREPGGQQSSTPMPSDGLFAPVVPAEPQPDGPPVGRRPSAPPPAPAQAPAPAPAAAPAPAPEQRTFDPTETTPIFEEIASAWFRSNRQIPVDYDAQQAGQPAGQATTQLPAQPASQPSTPQSGSPQSGSPQPGTAPQPGAAQPAERPEAPAAPVPGPDRRPTPAPVAGQPQRAPQPRPEPEPVGAVAGRVERGFATEADDGWRAANGAVSDRASELTTAGLPKRRPRARLVPGSAGSAVLAAPASPARSAENIRGRLASYQQGVRQGRERRLRGEAAPNGSGSNGGNDPANAGGNHDEESS